MAMGSGWRGGAATGMAEARRASEKRKKSGVRCVEAMGDGDEAWKGEVTAP